MTSKGDRANNDIIQNGAPNTTEPIITRTAAREANSMDVDADDIQSEASSSSGESILTVDTSDPTVTGVVTVRGVEPLFGSQHIVAESVSTHGHIRPFEAVEAIPALDPALRDHIGQVHADGAIQKWLAKRAVWDEKYAKQLEKWRKIRLTDRQKAEAGGFLTRDLQGERPPLCALVGLWDEKLAREVGKSVDGVKRESSMGVMWWMNISSKADKEHAGGDSIEEIRGNVEKDAAAEARTRSDPARAPP